MNSVILMLPLSPTHLTSSLSEQLVLVVYGRLVSPLHMNPQVANFQGCERVFTCPVTSGMSDAAACPPSPLAEDPSAPPFPPPVPPPAVTLLACSLDAHPCIQLLLLCFSKFCNVRVKIFSLFFVFIFVYYLCGKYSKPITILYN